MAGPTLSLLALLAAAAALRPQLSGVGPLLDQLSRGLGISHAEAGLLATIPVACMGLFALPSARLMSRFGTYPVMTGSLVAISAAGLLRAIAPDAATLMSLTVVFGVGAGVAGTLLPGLVKTGFAARATEVTAFYSVALNGAAAVSAALAAPIAAAMGGWRGALAVFGVWCAALTVVWVTIARGADFKAPVSADDGGEPPGGGESPGQGAAEALPDSRRRLRPRRPHRGRSGRQSRVWLLALIFGLQATVYYGLNAWLADAYRERGWGIAAAGALVGVLNFSTLPATLAVAGLARRMSDRFRYLMLAAGALGLAILGVVLVPGGGFAWSAVAGVSLGTIFPLCMAAPVEFGRDAEGVTRATGTMLGAGYLFAALAPFVLGALRDRTGSFTAGIWMLLGVAVVLFAVCGRLASDAGRRAASSPR